jgi:hypothetical protein
MNFETARQLLTARFESQWPTLLGVGYDRFIDGISEPDFSTQQNPFGFFGVEVLSNRQSALNGDAPPTRSLGVVTIGIFAREGTGTKPFTTMHDAMVTAFASRDISGISCMSLNSSKRIAAIGWQSRVLRVDFRFDSI